MHQDDVAEVDRAALPVGEPAVVEHLQQDVEGLGVGLLDLVEQHHRVGPTPHRLGELAALLVADVAGRRPDQPRDRVPLGVLATCRCAPSRARRRTGSRRATWRARSCPRPVGPRKRKDPVGRSGSATPARERRTASDTARTASVWPIRRAPMIDSIESSFSVSPCSSRPGRDAGPRRDHLGDVVGADPLLDHQVGGCRGRLGLLGQPRARPRGPGSRRRAGATHPRSRPRAAAGRPGCAGRRAGP